MNKPLKVAVVGLGGIGRLHATCYKNDELAELVAVCDWQKDLAQKVGEQFGVDYFTDMKELLNAHPELDFVSIATSGYENGSWHYEPVMMALDAGKNVLVEKPISNRIEEAREMVAFAAKKGLYLGNNLNHYFSEPAYKADELIAQNKIGQPVYLMTKVGFNGSSETYGGKGTPRWNMPYSHAKAFLTHPFSVLRHYGGNITHIQAFMDKPGAVSYTNQTLPTKA